MEFYVPVGGSTGAIFQALLLGPLVSRLGDQKISLGEWQPNHAGDLEYLAGLLEAGKLITVIDRVYPLGELPEAMRRLAAGQSRGKLVIRIASPADAAQDA